MCALYSQRYFASRVASTGRTYEVLEEKVRLSFSLVALQFFHLSSLFFSSTVYSHQSLTLFKTVGGSGFEIVHVISTSERRGGTTYRTYSVWTCQRNWTCCPSVKTLSLLRCV